MQNNIKIKYKFIKKLGEGTYSKVIKSINRETKEEFAVKVIEKKNLTKDDFESWVKEIEILSQFNHPNIVRLYEIFEDDDRFYMVLDYMKGGELIDNIRKRKNLYEKDICDIIITLVDTIKYYNSKNITHRDIKPENILLDSQGEGAILKLSDFGFAKISLNGFMTTKCGTPHFVAPEILNDTKYTKSCDIWSIGILMYYLISGSFPFEGVEFETIFGNIVKGEFNFNDKLWKEVTEEAKDLIKKMLILDYDERIKPEDILNHAWRETCLLKKFNLIDSHN